jgi:hypothetical protein
MEPLSAEPSSQDVRGSIALLVKHEKRDEELSMNMHAPRFACALRILTAFYIISMVGGNLL